MDPRVKIVERKSQRKIEVVFDGLLLATITKESIEYHRQCPAPLDTLILKTRDEHWPPKALEWSVKPDTGEILLGSAVMYTWPGQTVDRWEKHWPPEFQDHVDSCELKALFVRPPTWMHYNKMLIVLHVQDDQIVLRDSEGKSFSAKPELALQLLEKYADLEAFANCKLWIQQRFKLRL